MNHEAYPQIVGLGMSVFDLSQVVTEFPSSGGVTRIIKSSSGGGGPVPTALCAAAHLGISTAILDRIGDDWLGHSLSSDYQHHGVNTRHLYMEAGKRSAMASVLVRERDGERHILYEPGDTTPLSGEDLPWDILSACRILHLNGRHRSACRAAAKIVHEAGAWVSFDGGANRYETSLVDLFPEIDILIVAANFADQAVGEAPKETQLSQLARWGATLVGITEGAKGSWFLDSKGDSFHQVAYPAHPLVDTTGCGDVFHGAFLAAVLENQSFRESARFASACAALSASALGGRGYLPSWVEVQQFLQQL